MNGVYLISILNSEAAISPGASTSRTTLKHSRKAPATSRKSRRPPVLGCRYFKRLTSRRVDLGNFLPSWKEFSRRRLKQETSKLTRPLCTKVIQKELYLKPTDPVLQGSLFKYLADSVCIIQDALTLLQKPKAAWAGCTQKPFLHSKRWQRTTCPHRLCWGKGHRRCPTNHVTWLPFPSPPVGQRTSQVWTLGPGPGCIWVPLIHREFCGEGPRWATAQLAKWRETENKPQQCRGSGYAGTARGYQMLL